MSSGGQVHLRGITWDHARGLDPLIATADSFRSGNPSIDIRWEVRSGEQFVDAPLESLARAYDLIVFDHPSIGEAVAGQVLLPLEQHVPSWVLQDQAVHSVGLSHESYSAAGSQWAFAIDAAALVSARSSTLVKEGIGSPVTWEESIALMNDLRSSGRRSAIATTGVDLLMHLIAIVAQAGEAAGATNALFSRDVGISAVERLRVILELTHSDSRLMDHPQILGEIAAGRIDYSPLVFGYSIYASSADATPVWFSDIPSRSGSPQSVLGGAGLGVSAFTESRKAAVAYASHVAARETQRTTYAAANGQPGHGAAWEDDALDRAYGHFYRGTRTTVENAVLRPRFNGWLRLQRDLAEILARIGLNEPVRLVDALNSRYLVDMPVAEEYRGRMPR